MRIHKSGSTHFWSSSDHHTSPEYIMWKFGSISSMTSFPNGVVNVGIFHVRTNSFTALANRSPYCNAKPSTIMTGLLEMPIIGKSYGYSGLSMLSELAHSGGYPNRPERLKLDPRCSVRDRKKELEQLPEPHVDAAIDQGSFWFRISKFFQPSDIILTETGTASAGGQDFVLPRHACMVNSAA